MTRLLEEFQRPYGRERGDFVHVGREGSYWQAADGLIVRRAAAETMREAEAAARTLLDLAIAYASGR